LNPENPKIRRLLVKSLRLERSISSRVAIGLVHACVFPGAEVAKTGMLVRAASCVD